MTDVLYLHPDNPQVRFVRQAVAALQKGALIAYPTDSCYAFGWRLEDKAAMERVARLRAFDKRHHYTLVCRDLAEIAKYARVENWQYRLLKLATPGPYTFILEATKEVPKRLMNEKRRTLGLRVPDHPVVAMLLEALGEPIMSSTLALPGDEFPLSDPTEIADRLDGQVDLVLDNGVCGLEPTTVLDLVGGVSVVRRGKGDLKSLGIEA
jgi:tRNA threonylcarbamoyl adenosine modification protein (Sua5/YciO/YrdC/YwlC family)